MEIVLRRGSKVDAALAFVAPWPPPGCQRFPDSCRGGVPGARASGVAQELYQPCAAVRPLARHRALRGIQGLGHRRDLQAGEQP